MALDLRELSRQLDRSPTPADRRRRIPFVAIVAVTAIVLVAIAAIAFFRRHSEPEPVHAPESLNVQRVTARGVVTSVAVSPDGKYAAYSSLDNVLRLRQLATGQELELVNADPKGLWGQTFTPDGSAIVYGAKDPDNAIGEFYRIATIGGRPEHLLDGMESPPTFSPDGKRMAWVRAEFPHPMESALMVANSDGSNARALVTRRPPEQFAPCFFCGPSWSPDGRLIAVSFVRNLEPREAELLTVDVATGKEHSMLRGRWQSISQAAWLPDGSAVAFVGSDQVGDMTQMQVWLVSYPSGVARRVTNELLGYRGVSVSADGQSLLTVAFDVSAQIWSVPLGGHGQSQRISNGKFDGWEGLACTPDGRVVYATIEDKSPALFIMNADGTGRTTLTRDGFDNRLPTAFHEGIAYVASTPDGNDVCFIRFDGEGRRVIVHGVDVSPIAVSPDGKSLIFGRNRRLWKTSIHGNPATPTPLVNEVSSGAAWSPSGDRIAFFTGDSEDYAAGLAVMNAADGRIVWRGPTRNIHKGSTIHWIPDGSSVIVNNSVADDMNLWLYDFHNKPRRLTSFVDQRAFYWDLLPDGKTALVSRAAIARDAVRLTGFR